MWLVLSAVAEELAGLDGVPVGVGPVAAGVRAARLFAERPVGAAVLVGTAGTYGDHQPGDVVIGRRHGYGHASGLTGQGYVPAPPPVLACPAWMIARAGVPGADVLTVGAITTAPDVAERWSRDWQVEHMEAYAVALAAAEAGVPFAAVLGVSNVVGPQAHAQWLANRGEAEAAAVAVARRMVAGRIPDPAG